jgi:1,4-alpha-glucan branching enzyme
MNFLRVWAPDANRLEALVRRHPRLPMKKEADGTRGWWSVTDPEIGSDVYYAFIIDGKEQFLPDPWTRFQPGGGTWTIARRGGCSVPLD